MVWISTDHSKLRDRTPALSLAHNQSTPIKKKYECGICRVSVDTEDDLHKHLTEHSNASFQEEPWDPSLTYEHVAISPIRNSDLIDISDHGDLDISCTVDVSTEKPKFSCTICDFSSKFKQNLQRHLKGHKFEKAPKLRSDSKAENQIKVRAHFRCDVCTYTTKYKFNLNRHVSRVHSDGRSDRGSMYICQFCGKKLRSKFAQTLHLKTLHTKVFKHTCPTCSKGFNQLTPYRGHLASHHDILKEKCDLCSESFNHKTSLTAHRQAVHDKRTFQCSSSSCSAVYSSSRAMRDHVKAEHNNERLRCKKCPNTYKWRSSLKYHMDTAH